MVLTRAERKAGQRSREILLDTGDKGFEALAELTEKLRKARPKRTTDEIDRLAKTESELRRESESLRQKLGETVTRDKAESAGNSSTETHEMGTRLKQLEKAHQEALDALNLARSLYFQGDYKKALQENFIESGGAIETAAMLLYGVTKDERLLTIPRALGYAEELKPLCARHWSHYGFDHDGMATFAVFADPVTDEDVRLARAAVTCARQAIAELVAQGAWRPPFDVAALLAEIVS